MIPVNSSDLYPEPAVHVNIDKPSYFPKQPQSSVEQKGRG